MKRLLIITTSIVVVVLAFFVTTNPSTYTLKQELPGMLNMWPDDFKDCVTVGKTENWFVYSRFKVTCVCEEWSKEYIGIAGNFREVKP